MNLPGPQWRWELGLQVQGAPHTWFCSCVECSSLLKLLLVLLLLMSLLLFLDFFGPVAS